MPDAPPEATPEAVRRIRRTLFRAFFVALLGVGALAATADAQPRTEDADVALALLPDGASEAAHDGGVLYAYYCAVCHGESGRGFDEAVRAFPPDHRTCTRCHRPANPPTMAPERIRADDVFDVGRAPALFGPDAEPGRRPHPDALRAYLTAAMPRQDPGMLGEHEYDALVSFLRAVWTAEGRSAAP